MIWLTCTTILTIEKCLELEEEILYIELKSDVKYVTSLKWSWATMQ